MHGIEKPGKIPLPNTTRWNSWFKMVFYAKDHIGYWPSFFMKNMKEIKIMNQFQQLMEFCKMNQKKEQLPFILILLHVLHKNLFRI
jgi:hypothetical protein